MLKADFRVEAFPLNPPKTPKAPETQSVQREVLMGHALVLPLAGFPWEGV